MCAYDEQHRVSQAKMKSALLLDEEDTEEVYYFFRNQSNRHFIQPADPNVLSICMCKHHKLCSRNFICSRPQNFNQSRQHFQLDRMIFSMSESDDILISKLKLQRYFQQIYHIIRYRQHFAGASPNFLYLLHWQISIHFICSIWLCMRVWSCVSCLSGDCCFILSSIIGLWEQDGLHVKTHIISVVNAWESNVLCSLFLHANA